MENGKDCLLIEDAMAMNSKMPMKQIYSCVVCTKDHFFIVPTKSIGMFVLFNTIKNHAFFEGLSIPEGLRKIVKETESVDELEDKLKDLLENDEKYIFAFADAKDHKIKGFLGKKTLTYRKDGMGWASFSPKSKADGKALVAFYEN
ncbi:MAG: hypothetical protein MI810_19460 [Flavobacteriales bacterium]|jgi:hypothetical protein|nr:hypothetical protein [Flavobacteriales bacterium]